MRSMNLSHFLDDSNNGATTPIRLYLSGYSMNVDQMKELLLKIKKYPHPILLHFSYSGISEASAILLAESLNQLIQPITLHFEKSGLETNGRCISAFTAAVNHYRFPFGTRILGLSGYIRKNCFLSSVYLVRMLFALSPYTTDPDDKTKKFPGFPRDIAQMIMGFLITAQLDIAFKVREKIASERVTSVNRCR